MKTVERFAALVTLLAFFAAAGLTVAAQTGRASSETEIVGVLPLKEPETPLSAGLVNLNTAGVDELCALHGIGPALAQRIIDYREEYGGFTSIADIIDVRGIGFATFDKIKDKITV